MPASPDIKKKEIELVCYRSLKCKSTVIFINWRSDNKSKSCSKLEKYYLNSAARLSVSDKGDLNPGTRTGIQSLINKILKINPAFLELQLYLAHGTYLQKCFKTGHDIFSRMTHFLFLSSGNFLIIKLSWINLPLSNSDACRQMFLLLGDRFWNNLPSALRSRYSRRPVAYCWQCDVLWRELLVQKESAAKEWKINLHRVLI